MLVSGLLAGVGALALLTASRAGYEHLAAERKAALVRAKAENADLQVAIADTRRRLDAASRAGKEAANRAVALAAEGAALEGRLGAAEKQLQSLDETRQELKKQKVQTAALTAQLSQIEADRRAEETGLARYKASLEETAKELEQLGATEAKHAIPRARFRARLGGIWQKLSQIELPRPTVQLAVASPAADPHDAPNAPTSTGGSAAGSVGLGGEIVGAIERAFKTAGVNFAGLLAKYRAAPAEGGPFVPPPAPDRPGEPPASPEKLAAIASLIKILPLAAPLGDYDIGSGFGVRTDPFNRKPSFHTGIDMDAPYGSPVYAAAPGTVIYAGWLGDYGRAVEIDHGLGIVTLYGHLRRCLVAAGQAVAAHAEIGLVGSTGRSTGPHVHYEVRVDGRPLDPEKFLGLARLLPAAARALTPAAARPAENSR